MRLCWSLALLTAASLPLARGDDAATEAVLRLISSDGRPIPASRIDRRLALDIYRVPGAGKALGDILPNPGYDEINRKLGELRAELVRECWAEVVRETGVELEINNAGKANGALSDLDLFFFTQALRSRDNPAIDASGIHAHVLARFLHHWNSKTGNLVPGSFDIALIPGDSLLVDWRMSKLKPGQFAVRQAMQIARLSNTEGAYWVPGGYKQQVYVRYLAEGRLLRVSPSLTSPAGVEFQEGATREMSRLYEQVRADWDRSANTENILQNFQQAEENARLVKRVKYGGRLADPRPLTNLEVDFRFLNLTGQKGLIEQHVRRLFAKGVPPEIGSIEEAVDLVQRMDRIELDKIIFAMGTGERPTWWAEHWRKHTPARFQEAGDKDRVYLARESKAVVAAARAAGRDLSGDVHLTERVRLAEEMFFRKIMALSRHLAGQAAVDLFQDVFTRQGFARFQAAETERLRAAGSLRPEAEAREAAHRRVIERSLGLRSILVFIDDPDLIRTVIEAAPPELRPAIRQIVEIPETQRRLIRQRDALTAQDLQEVIPLIDQLRARLGVDSVPAAHLAELSDDFGLRRRAELLFREAMRKLPPSLPASEMPVFFRLAQVPPSPADWLNQSFQRAADLGTVDLALRVFTSYSTGNSNLALQQFREGMAELAFGPAWSLATAYRDARNTGDVWPFLKFAGVSAAPLLGIAPHIALATAAWGIANSAYQLAWHFYLEPNQNLAVSYVLMGDDTALRKGLDPSSPGPGNLSLLRETALLRRHISIPNLSARDRSAVARSLFWADANRETMRALPPGTVRAEADWNWRDAAQRHRDGLLAGYARTSDYWLRRLWLYNQVNVPFARWAASATGGTEWQRISEIPPLFMREWSESSQMEAYPDAFQRSAGRVLWDHERIWLRRYFNTWIDDYWARWRRAGPEGEALFRYLRSASPDWEAAVVNQLIAYYLEGEIQELKSRDRAAAEKAAGDARTAVETAGKEVARTMARIAAAADEAAARIEQLYWHPALADRLGKAMVQAAQAQPALRPGAPELRVRLYSPVVKADGEVHGEYLVLGPAAAIPDDLESSVTYSDLRPAGRPAEATAFRVRTLLGQNFDMNRLLVFRGVATFSVKSASQPSFALSATRDVWVVAERPSIPPPVVTEARPSLIRVPSVAGLSGSDAVAKLRNLGLRPRTVVTAAAPAPARRHTAHATKPAAGSDVAPDSEIQIELFGDAGAGPTAPNVRGLPVAEAEARLAAAGLYARREVLGPAPPGVPHLVVAAQAPEPGAPVERGASVTVRFHDQPAPAAMPRLIGMTTEQAQAALRAAGLQPSWRRMGSAASSDQVNRVGAQEPAAGWPVRAGTAVEVGYFDSVAAMVVVPNVQGRMAEDARAQLAGLGLTVNLVPAGPPPSRDQAMRVRAQNPAANARVAPGTPVAIEFYGDNPAVLTMPQLTGRPAREAQKTLQDMGLRAEFKAGGRARNPGESGLVTKQSPAAGTVLKPGAAVRVEYLPEFRGSESARTVPNPAGTGPAGPLMPMLVGFRRAEVEPTLRLTGIAVEWREIGPAPSAAQEGRIVRQSVAPFAVVPRGSAAPVAEHYGAFRGGQVAPRIAPAAPPVAPPQRQQPQPFALPNAIGQTSGEAVNTMARVGLRAALQSAGPAASANQSDRVARTEPPPGTMVLPGTIVWVHHYERFTPAAPPPRTGVNPPPSPPARAPAPAAPTCPPNPGAVSCPKVITDVLTGGCLTRTANGSLTTSCHYAWMLGSQEARMQLFIDAAPPQGGCGAVTRAPRGPGWDRLFVNSSTRRAYVMVEASSIIDAFIEPARQVLRQADRFTQTPCR